MRLAYFVYDHPENPFVGGGGAVRAREMNRRLVALGYEVVTITGKYDGAEDYEEDGVKYRFLGRGGGYVKSVFSYKFAAAKYLKKFHGEYDVIIEEFAPWNTINSYKYQNDQCVILQQHHLDGVNILKRYPVIGYPFYLKEKNYHKKFKNIISCSDETLQKLGRSDGLGISSGIEDWLLKAMISDGGYLLYVGRIDMYNKGVDLLVQADLKKDVIIAGKGKDSERLTSMIADKPNYKYVGFVDDKEKYRLMANCSAMIMPSRFEGQGIVAIEAAALGKPVVVSDIFELEYVVKNGFGISFESDNHEGLRLAVDEILEPYWKDVKKSGRDFASKYTWDSVTGILDDYIKTVCRIKG